MDVGNFFNFEGSDEEDVFLVSPANETQKYGDPRIWDGADFRSDIVKGWYMLDGSPDSNSWTSVQVKLKKVVFDQDK